MIEEITIAVLSFLAGGIFTYKVTTKYFNSSNKSSNWFSNNNTTNQDIDNDK